jgi:hypothetical protein
MNTIFKPEKEMLFIFEAVNIAAERCFISFLNIILFRNTFKIMKEFFNTFVSFMLTIYLIGKFRIIISSLLRKLNQKIRPKAIIYDAFSINNLKSFDLNCRSKSSNNEFPKLEEEFMAHIKENSRNDLFR